MLLHPDEIKKSISNYGWNFSDNKICKTFKFDTFQKKQQFGELKKKRFAPGICDLRGAAHV